MISDETLDELERLSAACDPGPWFAVVEGRDAEAGDSFVQTGPDDRRGEDLYVTRDSGPADARYLDLLAAARTHLPLLVSEVRALRAHRDHPRFVECVVTRHEPYGFYVDLGEGQDGVVTIAAVVDDPPVTPADFPPIGTRLQAVLLGHTEFGDQPRLSTRPSDLAELTEQRQGRSSPFDPLGSEEPRLVLPPDFDDYAWEVESKGVLLAEVHLGTRHVEVSFYDPTRLAQDIEGDLTGDHVISFARLIVVERLTIENMRRAVSRVGRTFFDRS